MEAGGSVDGLVGDHIVVGVFDEGVAVFIVLTAVVVVEEVGGEAGHGGGAGRDIGRAGRVEDMRCRSGRPESVEESGRVAKERRDSMTVGEAGVGEKLLEEAWAALGGEVVGQAGVEGRGETRRYR